MNHQRILALSSSRFGNGGFLETAAPLIHRFLGEQPLKIAFIPFASVKNDHALYTSMVSDALSHLPYTFTTVTYENAAAVIEQADVIMTGGGNTFKLLHDLYTLDLLELVQQKVNAGIPYIGWSAGANITGLTISTTNDMPIIAPAAFEALAFFPFQLNPHYSNYKPEGFNGETRDQRLEEFLVLNPATPVVALPEGSGLKKEGNRLEYSGTNNGVLFSNDPPGSILKKSIVHGQDLSFLL